MPSYNYKVVSFAAQVKNSRLGETGGQLEAAINRESVDGWEFYQLGAVNIQVSPGCLSALFGAKDAFIQVDQLIFRRQA